MNEHGIGVPTTRLSFHPGGKKTNPLEKFVKEAGMEREGRDPDIDPAKAKDNVFESQYGYTSGQEVIDHARRRLEEISKARGKAVRKDAVPLCSTIVKPSAAIIQKLKKDEQMDMCRASVEEAQIVIGARILAYETKKKMSDIDRTEALERGKKATVMVAYHFDEGAPHPHILWEPITWKDGIPKTEAKIHDTVFLGGLNKIAERMNERGYDFKLAFDYLTATEEQREEHKNVPSGMSSLEFKKMKREEYNREIEAKKELLSDLNSEIEVKEDLVANLDKEIAELEDQSADIEKQIEDGKKVLEAIDQREELTILDRFFFFVQQTTAGQKLIDWFKDKLDDFEKEEKKITHAIYNFRKPKQPTQHKKPDRKHDVEQDR